jgi:hypothetical protein
MFLLLEEMVESEQTLQNGVVFVADQATLGLKHFKQFSISRILLILSVLQVRTKYPKYICTLISVFNYKKINFFNRESFPFSVKDCIMLMIQIG